MLVLNKKIVHRIIVLIFLSILLFQIKSLAVVKPTANFYVNDYANLLSPETENYIMNTNISLNNQTGAQVVVVTVPNLEGNSLEEYATQLFREFGIGDKNKNNGVLLLLALEERQFRVEVGYGLEGCLTDGKTGRIQDEYIIPYLKQNDWDNGIKNGFSAIVQEIANEYDIDINGLQTSTTVFNKNEIAELQQTLSTTIYLSAFGGMIIGMIKRIKKIKWKTTCIILLIYILVTIIILLITSNIVYTMLSIMATLIGYLLAYVGGYSHGGRFGGGRFIIIRRWLIFWRRRRLFWRRRKLKKFLICYKITS